jgi:hypothetical protein
MIYAPFAIKGLLIEEIKAQTEDGEDHGLV